MTFQNPARLLKGFTLIELLIVLAISVISLSIAVPGFGQLVSKNDQTNMINAFSTSLAQARYYAVHQHKRVTLCPSSNLEDCTGGIDWHHGYITFVDSDKDRQRDTDEKILSIGQKNRTSVKIQTSTGRRKITYHPSGYSPGSNATIRFCSEDKRIAGKALIISNSGRPRLSDKLTNGKPIDCIST